MAGCSTGPGPARWSLFDVDPVNGDLSFRECVSADPDDFPPSEGVREDCETYENGLWGARDIAISPDGKSVYVESSGRGDGHGADAIVLVRPDPVSGGVASVTCLFAGDSRVGCPAAPYGVNPTGIVVSPDGTSVYTETSYFFADDELYSFARDPLTGALTPLGCIGSADPDVYLYNPCSTRVRGLTYPRAISVTPDGRSIYVGSIRALVGFDRTGPSELPTGTGCVRSELEAIEVDCFRTAPVLPREFAFGPNGLAYGRADGALAVFRWLPEPRDPAEPPDDTTAPDTGLAGKARRHGHRIKLSFDSSESHSSFTCRLDGRRPRECASPVRYRHLPRGAHAFTVAAADVAGNEDATPARHDWRARGPRR